MGKARKPFSEKVALDDDSKNVFKYDNAAPSESNMDWPSCGNKLMKSRWSYRCDVCDATYRHTVASKELTEAEMNQLLYEKHTDVLSGFVSKKGDTFEAALLLTDDNEVKFDF